MSRLTLSIWEDLLPEVFFYGRIYFPAVANGAQGDYCVGAFQGDIVAAVVIAGEFEEFGDPVGPVVVFQAEQEVQGQLGGYDITGDGQEVSGPGVEGEHDHVVHFKGELGKSFVCFCAHDLGGAEVLFEGGLDVSADRVCGTGEAAEGQEEGGCEGDDLVHKNYFLKCFWFLFVIRASPGMPG